MSEKTPLLKLIKDAVMEDGMLLRSFSLPHYDKDPDPNKVRFADGAMDGIGIYHMGRPQITDEHMQLVDDAFRHIDDDEKAMESMREFFSHICPIEAIDAIQDYIIKNSSSLDAKTVYTFAVKMLNSTEIDMVKLGLIIIEIFNEPDEQIKEAIRTLGLSDEFTIFSVFNMMTWENGNSEVFELAKSVHGWGRIHAVKRLEPETPQIRDWLLMQGVKNDVVPAYSALDVYSKVGISAMLKHNIADYELDLIADVLDAMFDEGPVRGISALGEEAAEMIGDFIDQAETHRPTLGICEMILTISEDERFSDFKEKCREYLNSEKCTQLIDRELENGKAIRLAQAVGIPFKEKIFNHMKANFNSGYSNLGALIDDEAYREGAVELFRTSLPIEKMLGEPTTDDEHFYKYADYNKLAYLVQWLKKYPLCGADMVAAAIRTPIVQCRVQALHTIKEWCDVRECAISELSDELYQALEYLKKVEVDDGVKKTLAEYSF